MRYLLPASIVAVALFIASTAQAATPEPTLANVPYGEHPRQVMDVYLAESSKPAPVVFFIHGGGWNGGDKQRSLATIDVSRLLGEGVSVVSINYRLVPQATEAGIKPPVKWPLSDACRALQFVRSKAEEWKLDKQRIGACGGSAGACSSLWLAMHDEMADPQSDDPIARESSRLWCAAVNGAQTSLDPHQMREWIPNSRYGGHAFGFANKGGQSQFESFYAAREEILPWIKEYSPIEHASADDPPLCLYYRQTTVAEKGTDQQDPTHSTLFGKMLREKLDPLGVEVLLTSEGEHDPQFTSITDYLLVKLKAPRGNE